MVSTTKTTFKWKANRAFRYCPWEKCMAWQTRLDMFTWKCDCGKILQAAQLPLNKEDTLAQ